MNFKRMTCVFAALAATVVMSIPASALTPTQTKVTVPFEFIASGKTLPAGVYTFAESSAAPLLVLRNARGDASVSFLANRVGPTMGAAKPQLVFKKVNGKHYLAEVWLRTAPGGYAVAGQ